MNDAQEKLDLFNNYGVLPFDAAINAYLGIDPGKNGALVVLANGKVVFKSIIPLSGDNVDIKSLYQSILDLMGQYNLTVILEEVHSIYGSSAGSNFVFGFVCGVIEAVVISHRLKLVKVQPKTWQKEIWINSDICYKAKKPDQKRPSIDTKTTSLNAANRLFPSVDFRKSDRAKIPHDGIIDAVCLTEYARRKNL